MNNPKKFHLVLISNSPGEISSWVKPIVEEARKKSTDIHISLILPPCNYASGREVEIAESYQIDAIVSPEEFKEWAYKKKELKKLPKIKDGSILYLGGDMFVGVIARKKLKYPLYAYAQHRALWQKYYSKYFIPNTDVYNKFKKKVAKAKLQICGDLFLDSVPEKIDAEKIFKDYDLKKDKAILGLMPGSRLEQTKHLLPYYLRVAELVKWSFSNMQFVLINSPFIKQEEISQILEEYNKKIKGFDHFGALGQIVKKKSEASSKDYYYIKTDSGANIKIVEGQNFEAIKASSFILTIPGSNTAQIAAIGTPMLSIVPFFKPEAMLLDGLVGIVGNLPVIGKWIKLVAIKTLNKYVRYTALPNIKAKKMIVPELRGDITPAKVAKEIVEIMKNKEKLNIIRKELKDNQSERGAAAKIIGEIISL